MNRRPRPTADVKQSRDGGLTELWDNVRRAFAEFLLLPTLIIAAFLALAVGAVALDHLPGIRSDSLHVFLRRHFFSDSEATSSLLGTVAGSIITMTSLTITLLLIVVQQSAASLTAQVFDQFLRRRKNQFYFGFFVGLALFALVILASVDQNFNPIYGASLTLVLTIAALYFLIVLIYTTVDQMRPAVIIEAIHDHILLARTRQLTILSETRRSAVYTGTVSVAVESVRHGFVTGLNLALLRDRLGENTRDVEIELAVSLGSHVALGDRIATVKAASGDRATALVEPVRRAIHIEGQRDVKADPGFGIEQLQMIAWTSISTSKSNPAPGLLTIASLRDILGRWAVDTDKPLGNVLPVVYTDHVIESLMDTFETLAIVSSESMQHQNFIAVLRTFEVMFDRLPPGQQRRSEDLILRILSAMGDHVLTSRLDSALTDLAAQLESAGRLSTARSVRTAHSELAKSVGTLNSRSTRVTQPDSAT